MLRLEWTQSDGSLAAFEPDALIHELHEDTAEVTEHAVERGSAIADHVRPLPQAITLEGELSNHPVQVPATQMSGVTGSVQSTPLGNTKQSASVLRFSGPFDRVAVVNNLIQSLVKNATLVRIITSLGTYEDFAIVRFRVDRDGASGNNLPFTIDAKHVRIVETQRVSVRPLQRRAIPRADRGPQVAEPLVSDAQQLVDHAGAAIRSIF